MLRLDARLGFDLPCFGFLFAGMLAVLIGRAQDTATPGALARVTPWWLLSLACFAAFVVRRERQIVRREETASPTSDSRSSPLTPGRIALLVIAAACSAWVVGRIIEKEDAGAIHYDDVFWIWLTGVGLLLGAAVRRPASLSEWLSRHRADVIIVLVLTALAALLRFTWLGDAPSIIDGDEGLFGMAGLAVLDGQFFNPFATYHGAGTLYMHLIAGLMRLLGADVMGVRAITSIGGSLAIPSVYGLGRELAGRRAGFAAAVLMTVSQYHIHFSRIVSVTYTQGTFFNALALYLLVSGLRRGSASRLMLAGWVIGMYFLLYLDARMMIGIAVLMLFALAVVDRALIVRNLVRLGLLAIVFVIVAAPMWAWAARHPDDFGARFAAGLLGEGILEERMADTGKTAAQLVADTGLQMVMTITALPVLDYFSGGPPALDALGSVLFTLGLAYTLARLRRPESLILNVWLWAAAAAIAAFTIDEYGAGYHLLFVFPVVCVLMGIGLDRFIDLARMSPRAATPLAAVVLTGAALLNLNTYFLGYLPSCQYGGDTPTRLSARLGQYLGTLEPGTRAFLITDGRVAAGSHPSLDFLGGQKPVENVEGPVTADAFEVTGPTVFAAVEARAADLEALAQSVPGGEWDFVYDCDERVFVAYRIDAP